MNSFSTFGIFVSLLLAYCTPTQGKVYPILEARLGNGGKCITDSQSGISSNLVTSCGGTYRIEETKPGDRGPKTTTLSIFRIEGIDTMVGRDLVVRTSANTYVQMQLINLQDSQELFTMTTRPKLEESLYTYSVSAVYQYQEFDVLKDVSLSVFTYSTTGTPQHRFVIHSGAAGSTQLEPHILWTEKDFNFWYYDNAITLTLHPRPAFKKFKYKYFLVKFNDESSVEHWKKNYARYCTSDIPQESTDVYNFFRDRDPSFRK